MKKNNIKSFPHYICTTAFGVLAMQHGSVYALTQEDAVILAQANVNVNQSTKSSTRNSDATIVSGSTNVGLIPIIIYPGQVRVIEQSDVERIAIGNGKLVTATVVANKQIVLLGEAPGVTSLYVWLKNGTQRNYEITITLDNAQKTAAELRSLLTLDPEVKVLTVGERVVLNGKYSNQETAEKVKKIAAAYPQVLNLINQLPTEIILTPEKMVLFELKVIEVRGNAIDKLGIDWTNSANGGTSGPKLDTQALLASNANAATFGSALKATSARPFLSFLSLTSSVTSMLNFLESNGDLWTLSEPRISTVSGGKSKIHVGGQIPIPVASGPNGAIAIVYKDYGVIVEVEPVIDSLGNIRAKIKSEVSEADTRAAGAPTFATTKTDSEVSLKEGETLIISGLHKNGGEKAIGGVNGLMHIPLAGRLLSNHTFRNERIEMLLVVTPRIHVPGSEMSKNDNIKAMTEINKIQTKIENANKFDHTIENEKRINKTKVDENLYIN
jgi:pilus assembly protein CpaC